MIFVISTIMGLFSKGLLVLQSTSRIYSPFITAYRNCHNHRLPILEFYYQTTGQMIPEKQRPLLRKKHPNIEKLTNDRIQIILQILDKFEITASDACNHLHLFSMHPISTDNYGEILKECGFVSIRPQHIIKYHTIVKSMSMASLKKEGLVRQDFELEKSLLDKFPEWPKNSRKTVNLSESDTVLFIRTSVLQRYLEWRLNVTEEDFQKYCRNYLPLRHKPMLDIQESIDLALNEIKLNINVIRRNGFVIASDPINTKLILENVEMLAGMDIREAIKVEPAILKNNYNALLQIRDILEEFRIPHEFQQRCLKVYCMRPDTVRERLEELIHLKEYSILSSNPRVLSLVVHQKKMINRLNKIQAAKKQCFCLNHLISSNKVFNNYLSGFGSKVNGRDVAILINSQLKIENGSLMNKTVLYKLKRHKYWLHVSLAVIDENIQYLKQYFDNRTVYNNCQILLYPVAEIKYYIELFLKIRSKKEPTTKMSHELDATYNTVKQEILTDNQMLSLVLYEIEKKYHFSGDGIWASNEGAKLDVQNN